MTENRQIRRARLLRHAEKGGAAPFKDMLSPKGIGDARAYGENTLRGMQHTHIAVTGWLRTAQTAMGAIEGAGDVVVPHLDQIELIARDPASAEFKDIVAAMKATGKEKPSIDDFMSAAPAYVNDAADMFGGRLGSYLLGLPDGAHALVVGHSPIIELALHSLTRGAIVQPLPELGWVDVEYEVELGPLGAMPIYRIVNASVDYLVPSDPPPASA